MSSSSSNSKYEQVLEEIYQSTITMLRKSKPHMNDDLLKFIAQDLIRVATKRLADSKNSDETGVLCTLNDILQRRFPSQTNESDQPKSPEVTTPPKEQDETLNKNHKRKCCDDSSKSCYSDSAYNSRSSSRQSGVTKQEKFDNKFKLCQNKNTSSFKRNNSSNSLKSNSSSSFSQRRASVCGKPEEFNLKTSRECLFGSPLTALDVFRYKQLEKKSNYLKKEDRPKVTCLRDCIEILKNQKT